MRDNDPSEALIQPLEEPLEDPYFIDSKDHELY